MPCLKKVSNWNSSRKLLYECLSANSVKISSILLFEQINYFCNYPTLIQISNRSLCYGRKREQCLNNIYALWTSTEKRGEWNLSYLHTQKLQSRPNLIIIFSSSLLFLLSSHHTHTSHSITESLTVSVLLFINSLPISI